MLIRKVKLENIRSYVNHEINFPEGSVLLSGDIGSGKSSILLAIDFVLFGLRRSDLSGSMLLRNGKNSGFVELTFSVMDKDITLRRNLKRVKGSIVQDSGYVIIDGKKKEASALELKQIVLELLNYPMDLLTKSKPLVYHYTVYTPQEEMKHILYAENEVRLDTLRKVFGIDKYKRIKENSKIFIGTLKEQIKELELWTIDLQEIQEEKKNLNDNVKTIEKDIEKINSEKLEHELSIGKIKNDFIEYENKKKLLFELKTKTNLVELRISSCISDFNKSKDNLDELTKEVLKLKKDVVESSEITEDNFVVLIDQKKKDIKFLEDSLGNLNYRINEFTIKKNNSNKLIGSIKKLDICPVCKQRVEKEHKDNIINSEKLNISDCDNEIKVIYGNIGDATKSLEKFKEELEGLKDKLRDVEIAKIKKKSLADKESAISKIEGELSKIKMDIGKYNKEKNNLKAETSKFEGIDENYAKLSKEMELLQDKVKVLISNKGGLDEKLKQSSDRLKILDKEFEKKKLLLIKKRRINALQSWIENDFTSAVGNIERSIMLKVHHDFSNLFEKWFNTLVDTENLTVKLDEDFTPLIEQDGFKIDFECLSGGEKTAAALAYRLSLNQVINHVMGSLNTKDIIILDEPTDGFSEDQIDRMRSVLEELKLRQVIIVSHESKIESFVQNVIKLNKRNHVTEIMPY